MTSPRRSAASNTVIEAANRFAADGAMLPDFEPMQGTSFNWDDKLFLSWQDGKLFEYSDWHARDMDAMLRRDYKARQLEQVLCGPLEAAEQTIEPVDGDTGEAAWLREFLARDEYSGGMSTPIELIKAQMTSAIVYKKAFFEIEQGHDDDGKVIFKEVGFRPANTCRPVRSAENVPANNIRVGQLIGFEQEPFLPGQAVRADSLDPIWVPLSRGFIYLHGQRRDPANGVSDLEIAKWCYETKQKILFLWFQFAETVALPRQYVKAQDEGTARSIAQQVARLRNSGVIPIATPQGPQSVEIASLDSSGKGGDQFSAIIAWLDQAAANSILAGFTNLTNNEKSGGGWALSADASDFYLQQLESKNRELEREQRRLFSRLTYFNFGPKARPPKIKIKPLTAEDNATAVTLLGTAFGALARTPGGIPEDFVGMLAESVATKLGIDQTKTRDSFLKAAKNAQAFAEKQSTLQASQTAGQVASVAAPVAAAARAVKRAAVGQDPLAKPGRR